MSKPTQPALVQPVDCALQNPCCGDFVDKFVAPGAAGVGFDEGPLGAGSREALVPQGQRMSRRWRMLLTSERADWARGPSLPSMFTGRPTTMPTERRSS